MEEDMAEEDTIQYSDEESIIEQDDQIQQYKEQPFEKKEEVILKTDKMVKIEPCSIQIIYIMFKFFKKECEQICQPFHCKTHFSINSYIIEQVGECTKAEFETCIKKMSDFARSISYAELKGDGEGEEKKMKYYHSPLIIEKLKDKKITLCLFHQKLYGFSRQIPEHLIRKQINDLTKNMHVQGIRFKKLSRFYAKSGTSWLQSIYVHIVQYLKMIIDHYKQFFAERNIVVSIDQTHTFLLFHGERVRFIMQSKTTMKNALESMVCLFVKDTKIDSKLMRKYLKKSSIYPAYYSDYNNHVGILISKDNILRQLVQKSNNFMKYLGLDFPQQEIKSGEEPTIGFYVIPSPSIILKVEKIKQRIQDKSYDILTDMGVRYFRKVFVKEGKEKYHPFKELLVTLFQVVEEFKLKYDIMKQTKEPRPIKEIDDGLKYQILSGKIEHPSLRKMLKRDVLTEKIQMKKKYIISYNIVETPQEVTYWKLNKDGEQGQEVKEEDLKKGVYLKGLKKFDEKGEKLVNFEELITIL